MRPTIVLFGEAERGAFHTPHLCCSPLDLLTQLGSSNNKGILMAMQGLLSGYNVLYFRVKEEGFESDGYSYGLQFLLGLADISIMAVALPGVGTPSTIRAFHELCQQRNSILITTDQDLYDLSTCGDAN